MMEISIIVPTYKRVDQTLKTLELLFASTGWGAEYIAETIISDSTPDASLETAVKARFHNKIVYTKPAKPGIAANKNHAAQLAHHPILIFCDSDMEVEVDTLSNTIQSLQKHTSAAGFGGQVYWKGGEKAGQLDRPRVEDRLYEFEKTTYIESLYSRYFVTYKKVFWDVGGYDETVFNMRGEGSDLSIRYWRAGYPLAYDESLIVHHVHDAPDSAALRIDHPEWGVAKDLLLLGYKYDLFDGEYPNFIATIAANFKNLGTDGYYRMIQGIGKNMDLLEKVKPVLDVFRMQDKPKYDFKFLEVFSEESLLRNCIMEAGAKMVEIRKETFGES